MNIRLAFLLIFLSFTHSFFSQTVTKDKTPSINQTSKTQTEQDNYIKILWLDENRFIQLNEDYIKTVTNQQRAALGYIAAFVGNECEWDGAKNADESNLKCKLNYALGFGYQCSDQQLSFLKKWFRKDKKIIENLQSCKKTPTSSSTIQDRFISLNMFTGDGVIKIIYSAVGVDLDKQRQWQWTEESTYSFTENQIIQSDRKNLNGGFY